MSEELVTTQFFHDKADEKYVVNRVQDVEPILKANRISQTDGTDGYTASRDLKRVASIPLVVVEQWMKQDGINVLALTGDEQQKYFKKKLNDPDNRFLRTDSGGSVF
jgi:hypothetical protein